MAKRFTDTEIWDKEWFMALSPKEKCLVKFIFDKCDVAGIWSPNWVLASACVGEQVGLTDLEKFSYRLEFLGEKIFVADFIEFQYGELSDKCIPHKKVIAILKKYGLFERVSIGYTKGITTLKEEDKDKDKGMDLGKPENPLPKVDIPSRQPVVQAMADTWKATRADYPFDETTDMHALFEIGAFLANVLKIPWLPDKDADYAALMEAWKCLESWQKQDDFYKSFSLGFLAKTKTLQTIWQKSKEVRNGTGIIKTGTANRKSTGATQLLGKLKANLGAHAGGEQGSRA